MQRCVVRPFGAGLARSAFPRRVTPGHLCKALLARGMSSTIKASYGGERIAIGRDGLEIQDSKSPGFRRHTLPSLWLRDNCRCTKCVNQDTMQRNFNTFEIPKDIRPEAVAEDPEGVSVTWSQDGHESWYSWRFVDFYLKNDHRNESDPEITVSHWGPEIGKEPPMVTFDRVMNEADQSGIAELTRNTAKYGFVFVADTPFDDPETTKRLLERIAFIRVTHYGGFYDFTPDLAMADTAYTNFALPAHTDNTYFTDPAGLQAFHLLSHRPPPGTSSDAPVSGGESLLVDGFHAARLLEAEDPTAYKILSTVRLPWHASGNKGITIAPDRRYPVLELDEDTGGLHRVRWNNDDRGVVPFGEHYSPTDWYDAARKWDAILRRKDVEFWTQLLPGRPLIFDNWRVLHGRSAFQGIRRICGAYINRDDYISRLRNTNFKGSEIRDRVVG